MPKLKKVDQIRKTVNEVLQPLGINSKVEELLYNEIIIEPSTVLKKSKLKKGSLDGMVIMYFGRSKTYEVAEQMAGKKNNELWIYKETKSLKVALKEMLKGNKRKPIKVWN